MPDGNVLDLTGVAYDAVLQVATVNGVPYAELGGPLAATVRQTREDGQLWDDKDLPAVGGPSRSSRGGPPPATPPHSRKDGHGSPRAHPPSRHHRGPGDQTSPRHLHGGKGGPANPRVDERYDHFQSGTARASGCSGRRMRQTTSSGTVCPR